MKRRSSNTAAKVDDTIIDPPLQADGSAETQISTDRAPLVEEAHIQQLKKSIAALQKNIRTEESKIARYKDEVKELALQYDQQAAPLRAECSRSVTRLATSVIAACSSNDFFPDFKCELRDLLLQAVENLGPPDCPLPEWLMYSPPSPDSSPSAKDDDAQSAKRKHTTAWEDEEDGDEDDDFFKQAFEEFIEEQRREQQQESQLWRGDGKTVDLETQHRLRNLYRKLVMATHPDRAASESELAHRHELTSRITSAYKAGRLSVLLEIEAEMQREESQANSIERFQFFKDEILHLEHTRKLLDEQRARLKLELKQLKQSSTGREHNALKRQLKKGADFDYALFELKQSVRPLHEVSEQIERVIAKKMRPGALRRWLNKRGMFVEDQDPYEDMYEDFF